MLKYQSVKAADLSVDDVVALMAAHVTAWQRPDSVKRDALVVWRRYCCEPMPSIRDLASELGICNQRVTQIEARGLRHIRNRAGTKPIPRGTRLEKVIWGDLVRSEVAS